MPLFLMILYFSGKMEFRGQLEEATTELNSRFAALEASEKNSVTLALTEQRGHLCHLISCVKPLVVSHVFFLRINVMSFGTLKETLCAYFHSANNVFHAFYLEKGVN